MEEPKDLDKPGTAERGAVPSFDSLYEESTPSLKTPCSKCGKLLLRHGTHLDSNVCPKQQSANLRNVSRVASNSVPPPNSEHLFELLNSLRESTTIDSRIAKNVRTNVANVLSNIISEAVKQNSVVTWGKFPTFAYRALCLSNLKLRDPDRS